MAIRIRTKVLLTVFAFGFLFLIVFYDFAPDRELIKDIDATCAVGDQAFTYSMDSILGPQLIEGNHVETLLNGDEVFPSMLQAIKQAKKTITFETFIYWSGEVGKLFADALSDRARNGVKVHVLLDSIGSGKIDQQHLQLMKDAGAQVVMYHPVHRLNPNKVNNRTHRKIMVVDGKIGFTGGIGVADHWLGNANTTEEWRDTHYRLEGPAVRQMQAVFMDNWMETQGELLHGSEYFPEIPPAGKHVAQVFMSSPKEGSESARLMYMMSIAASRRMIRIGNAYFVPDELSVRTFTRAAKRGVKIQIIAPGKITDTQTVRRASRSRWGDLLKAGIEIYEYQPTMFHCKVMVVDDIWTSVGSTNFDNRSFRLNDEINLNVMNTEFAQIQNRDFENDLKKSKRVTYEEWANRPLSEKTMDFLAGLLRHQL